VNLHAVCTQCHNRWHAVNNIYYERERPSAGAVWLPDSPYWAHDPQTQFTDDEYEVVDEWFRLDVADRPEYPFYPTARQMLPLGDGSGKLPHSGNPFRDTEQAESRA
jgi:hypothetical protein